MRRSPGYMLRLLAALYAALASAAAWQGILSSIAGLGGGLAWASLAAAALVSSGSAAAVLLDAPALAWILAAFGAAASLADPAAVVILLAASSILYTVSQGPRPRVSPAALAAGAAQLAVAAAAGLAAARAASTLLAAMLRPPSGLPEPFATAWSSLGSTVAGRLLAAAAVLLAARWLAGLLQGILSAAADPLGWLRRSLHGWAAAALASQEWYHKLSRRLLYLALIPLEAPAALAAWALVQEAIALAAGGPPEAPAEKIAAAGSAAAAAWLAAAATKHAAESLLLEARGWRRATQAAAAALAATVIAAAAVQPSSLAALATGEPPPPAGLDTAVEEALRSRLEGLEDALRSLLLLLWG